MYRSFDTAVENELFYYIAAMKKEPQLVIIYSPFPQRHHTNKILKALFNAANNKKCGVMAITMNLISFPFNCALPQPRAHTSSGY